MKINFDKNLAFGDQPKPILAEEVKKSIKPRLAKKVLDKVSIDISMFLPTVGKPEVVSVVEKEKLSDNEVRLKVENFKVGEHVFGPQMSVQEVPALGNKSPQFNKVLETSAFVPDHLNLSVEPEPLPETLKTPPFIRAYPSREERKRGNQATTIFPPDNRTIIHSTSFPWSACGRVDVSGAFGSGVMVGPRHLLTASHVIRWLNGSAGWIRFRPAYFDGSAPFGSAWGIRVYYKRKVSGPTIDWIEGMYDYVVVVLNTNMGNITGWFGSRGYTDSWDGGAYWTHVGYPGDVAGGNRPTYQSAIALDGAWWQVDSHEAMSHHGDVWPGQSGGPFHGWWSGESWPRVVAVQSSHNASENNASGGQDMVDLIIRARNEYP